MEAAAAAILVVVSLVGSLSDIVTFRTIDPTTGFPRTTCCSRGENAPNNRR
jgi:hypothetical protein